MPIADLFDLSQVSNSELARELQRRQVAKIREQAVAEAAAEAAERVTDARLNAAAAVRHVQRAARRSP
jgi:hypothetical protein